MSGTPEYMAPEQVRGREADGRADLDALGFVLYERLVGVRVFPPNAHGRGARARGPGPAGATRPGFPSGSDSARSVM